MGAAHGGHALVPGAHAGEARLEALEAEIFAAWGAFHARLQGETPNCAGFDVERARLFKAGATAVGFDDEDELAQGPTAAWTCRAGAWPS